MATILVIDDDRPTADVIAEMLREESYEVKVVYDGIHGLQQLETQLPDLILCDERMPRLAGHEVCERLDRDDRYRSIPVILMSAHNYDIRPGTANCLMFLRKPLLYNDLMNTVADVMGVAR